MDENFFQDTGNFRITIFFDLLYTISGLYGAFWLFKHLDKKYYWIKGLWNRLINGVIGVRQVLIAKAS